MKYLSLFSGIGGFELGIQQAYEQILNEMEQRGCGQKEDELETPLPDTISEPDKRQHPDCIGYSEIDRYATQIYQKHFPEHKNYGDITTINAEELPDFDLLVGGFPCQAFSIAGKRGGFDDTRGTMFFEIARIVREKQPRLLLLENVKGLLSHDQGRTFYTIISTLDELGYDLQWQVLNSKNHGVPQNRERVFIVGHLRGTPRPQVFPFGEADGAINEGLDKKNTKVEIASTIRSRYGNGTGSHIKQLNQPTHSNDRVYGTDGVSPTLNTMQGGNRQPFITDPQGRKNKVCKPKPYANTLRANTHGNEQVVNHIRRLTPTECERLQGFPDGWTAKGAIYGDGVGASVEISDTQRYKTLGNAVTVNVIKDIMIHIL